MMSEELKPAAVHDANVFLPGSLGPVRREVVLAYEHDRVVGQLRAELAALKAGQGEAVEVMRFQLKHPFSGESRIVEVNRADVVEGMEDALFEKLGDLICQCESVGETNVVDCNCDDYIYDFDLVPDVVTAPPASADAVSVPVELLAEAAYWLGVHSGPCSIEQQLADELRALLAQSESEGVK